MTKFILKKRQSPLIHQTSFISREQIQKGCDFFKIIIKKHLSLNSKSTVDFTTLYGKCQIIIFDTTILCCWIWSLPECRILCIFLSALQKNQTTFFCVFQKQIHNISTKLCKTSYSALLPSLNWRWKDNDGFLGAEGRTNQRNLLTTFLANHVLMSGLCPDYDDWRMAGSISIISRAQIIRPNRKNSPRSLNVVKSGLLPLYFWW